MAELTVDKLNRIYRDAEEVDSSVFAEMRSNVLLVSGEHYSQKTRNDRPRSARSQSETEQKIRLTKNHMHRLRRTYVKGILANAPSTNIKPHHETDIQDQKDAELYKAVWDDVKYRHKISAKIRDWASDYVTLGEVCVKIFWDHMAGKHVGFEPLLDEEGEPVMQPTGEVEEIVDPMTGEVVLQEKMAPVEDETKPMFTGDFVFERIFGFNLLRESSVQEMGEKGRAWVVRKMTNIKELQAKFPEKFDEIAESSDETYVVFDANKGSYQKTKGQTMVREFYWEPCYKYPKGWYAVSVSSVILDQGPLPMGIFPLRWKPFEKFQTSPRGRSILKVGRPYQAEINRTSSKLAEQQVTLGDDKLIYSAGSKLAMGALLPGVRGISVAGTPPTVLPGRDGSQYLPYLKDQIAELDQVTVAQEMQFTGQNGQIDPYALLYQSFSRKEIYQEYIEGFEEFLVDVTQLVLEVAKVYLPDDALIPAIGAREAVNIEEFRKVSDLATRIVVEAGTDTVETLFGRQLTLSHILQYVGKDLDMATKAKIMKGLPFGNVDDAFDDMMIDEEICKNDFLAMERGEQVQAAQYVEPSFMIKKITARMKKPEFRFQPPEVQQAYQMLMQQYQQIEVENQQKIIAAKNEYIPVDGALVSVDMYVNDPNSDSGSAKRARLPQRAVEWLIQQLESQGASLDQLENMNSNAMAQLAGSILQQQGPQPQMMGQ